MNFINKTVKPMLVTALALLFFTGCGSSVPLPYSNYLTDSSFGIVVIPNEVSETADSFGTSIVVATDTDVLNNSVDPGDISSAALFALDTHTAAYAKNIYTRLYPASMTKVMTALVALKNTKPDQMLTVTDSVNTLGVDAQKCGLRPGDTITMDQALHFLLVHSANDAAIVIAESVGGSSDRFASMMNEEAQRLGATNTNFINATGLTDVNHYTTAYDMYLIFNAALEYDLFREIINLPEYSTVYHDSQGKEKTAKEVSSNLYLTGQKKAPDGITVIGGKTGTTNAAGHCLILYAKDSSGHPYISVVMQARDQNDLYRMMNELLGSIPR